MKHNNQLPNAHFRKHWQVRVRTWLNQAGRKQRRRTARIEKAKRMFPRPVDSLRPAVRCQTVKYNTRLREGRGFTLEEIKAAGITKAYARHVGITVDHRRRNRCEESLKLNTERLQAYLNRLVVGADAKNAKQINLKKEMPIVNKRTIEPARPVTSQEANTSAFKTLRKAWGMQRYAGIRAKRAAEKAEATETKKEK